MKRIYNRDNRLESHPFFSYIAWTLVISFSLFVYHLAGTVQKQKLEIQRQIVENSTYATSFPTQNE